MGSITTGTTIEISYEGRLTDGTVFMASQPDEPVSVRIGKGDILPVLEKALMGQAQGDVITVDVAPKDGFGPYLEAHVVKLPRTLIAKSDRLYKDQKVQVKDSDSGEVIIVSVVDFDDDMVTIDGNHPLAGKDLVFELSILKVEA